jgi:hypothetical protein
MTSAEAKRILIAHRPGRDRQDAAVTEALELARHDPELQQWWKQQQAFHATMAGGFAQAPVPSHLREHIRARAKVVPFPFWQRPVVWAAAAAVVLLLGLAAIFWKPAGNGSFETFRSRMVRNVLRQYRMDMETNDMASIREFHATNNAPADYTLPQGVATLQPTGAGLLSWQGSRVSMVCLDSKTHGTLFLFVTEKSNVTHPPGGSPEYAQINKLMTASWTEGKKVYVLAVEGGDEVLKKYF